MREILFRGKTDKGEWVQGAYYHQAEFYGEQCSFHYIIESCDELEDNMMWALRVIPETIGQYTGLTDKNGKKIFEGDIVKGKDHLEKDLEVYGYIDHKNGSFVIVGDFMTHYRWLDYDVEVIGNIHDNPELLKGGEE